MIIVYSKSNCPQCDKVKDFLDERKIDYTAISLDDETVRNKFKEDHPKVRSVPYIRINGDVINNFESLKEWYNKNADF